MLGHFLFAVYINKNVESMISTFANDTNVGHIVDSEDGFENVQQGIDELNKCAEEQLKEFNVDK